MADVVSGAGSGVGAGLGGQTGADQHGLTRTNTDLSRTGADLARWKQIAAEAERQGARLRGQNQKFVELFRAGHAAVMGNTSGAEGTPADVNLVYMYVCAVVSALYAQAPTIEVEAAEGGGGRAFEALVRLGVFPDVQRAREEFAESLEVYLTRAAGEGELEEANAAALQWALLTGQAWSKVGFDPVRNLECVDTLRRDEVFVDPNARYSLRQAGYMLHAVTKEYEAAKAFFSAQGVEIGEPNWKLSDLEKPLQQLSGESQELPGRKQYRYYEIWQQQNGAQGRKLIYVPYGGDKILLERDWPFELEPGEYCFVGLSFNRVYAEMADAFTELGVTDGLREMVEELGEFFRKSTMRSLGKTAILDSEVFDDEDVRKMKEARELDFRLVDLGGRDIRQVAQVFDLNSPTDPTPEKSEFAKQRWEQVIGFDQLLMGNQPVARQMTAEEASIRAEAGGQRTGKRQTTIDAWQTRITRLRAQVARQLVQPDVVQQLAGERAALLWSMYDGDAAAFTREYTVGIQAGSTGERHRAKRVEMWRGFAQTADTANKAQPMGPQFNLHEIALEIARANNVRRPERYELAPTPLPGPAGPGMAPAGMPQAGAEGAGVAAPMQPGMPPEGMPAGQAPAAPVAGMPMPMAMMAGGGA